MSEKTKEVPRLADATYAHTLVINCTLDYKVNWPYGSNFHFTIGAMGPLFGFRGSGAKITVDDPGGKGPKQLHLT